MPAKKLTVGWRWSSDSLLAWQTVQLAASTPLSKVWQAAQLFSRKA
jgi:hypothetical protein